MCDILRVIFYVWYFMGDILRVIFYVWYFTCDILRVIFYVWYFMCVIFSSNAVFMNVVLKLAAKKYAVGSLSHILGHLNALKIGIFDRRPSENFMLLRPKQSGTNTNDMGNVNFPATGLTLPMKIFY